VEKPWIAERVVSPELAQSLIRSQFPEVKALKVEPLGQGFDNTVFRVDDDWVFRFPRRTVAAPLLETEVRVLPALAPRLPIPIPNPRWIGKPDAQFPWLFAGHPYVPGVAAARARLTNDQRLTFAKPMAAFLRALHGIDSGEMTALGAPFDEWGRLNVKARLPKTEGILDRLVSSNLVDAETRERVLSLLRETPEGGPRGPNVVVHGDLYGAQVLVDRHHRITGIIDWGDLHVGDAAVDLGFAFQMLPPSGRGVFFKNYGEVDNLTLRLARFRALTHAVFVTEYAADIGDDALGREAKLALEWATQ
jgi:aminoglycoside phosphotransferase (APT) family kinase protein